MHEFSESDIALLAACGLRPDEIAVVQDDCLFEDFDL